MSADDEYIDTYAAAEELGVSRATIWNLIRRHNVDRYRIPGELRTVIRRADLEKLRQPIKLDAPLRGRPRGSGVEGRAVKRAA